MHKLVKACIFILSLLHISHCLKAQNEAIIIDSKTKQAIQNVVIQNKKQTKSDVSDKEGYFFLSDFGKSDTLFFQHPSYQKVQLTIEQIKQNGYIVPMRRQVYEIPEFVVSASKFKEKKRNQPYKIDVIQQKTISLSHHQTSAEILRSTGNVTVQKSQTGGGSPVIRGLEANKILLVIDGVRMNNAIYRSGHLQNSITIDNAILEQIEVVYGPTSVMYGSDALGGVIHYFTKKPEIIYNQKAKIITNAMLQYSTVNNGKKAHIDVALSKKKWGTLSSVSYSKYGNLKMGENRNDDVEEPFGLDKYYAVRISGKDSMMVNPDPEIQQNTGYSQYDFLQKIRFAPTKDLDFTLNLQYSTSSKVYRYDKLNDYDDGKLKYAEWYYGPQNRLMAAFHATLLNENRFYNSASITAAYQKIDEDRHSRKFNIPKRLNQKEDVLVYSLNADFYKKTGADSRLGYGMEALYNQVFSEAFYRHIETEATEPAQTRYPDNGSYLRSVAAYLDYKKTISSRFTVHGGFRLSHFYLHSDFQDTSFVTFPFQEITVNTAAPSGSISVMYYPNSTWQLNFIGSTGFRAPNVDDYGKIRAKNELITVPNNNLHSEYAYNTEISISKTIKNTVKCYATFYHTWLRDAIVRTDYQLDGKDSLWYDGDRYRITTNKNAGKAVIRGISAGIDGKFELNQAAQTVNIKSTLNYTYGRNVSDDVPLGHIPPIHGLTEISYIRKKFTAGVSFRYQGWKHSKDFSPYGEDNGDEALPEGYPAWYIANLSSRYDMENFSLSITIENIFDAYYKVFASGISAPGRNFVFSLSFNM